MPKVNAWFPGASRGMWDSGQIVAAIRNELYPIPLEFNEINEHEYASDEGAVVIASGNVLRGRGIVEQTLERVHRMPWCVFVHTSDEELAFDSNIFKSDKCKVWLQQIRPPEASPIKLGDRNILLGNIIDTRPMLSQMKRLSLKDRPFKWAYSGQINNPTREACAKELVQINNGMYGDAWKGRFLFTDGFGRGQSRESHLQWLSEAAIAPCPSGSYTIETFRCYESLECGSLPIVNKYAYMWKRTDLDFWQWFCGDDKPFPVIEHWSEIHPLIAMYRDDPIKLQRDANKATAWWINYKRKFCTELVEDICSLGGAKVEHPPFQILIPTSPIAAHPDYSMLERTIEHIRSYDELKNADIVLMFDGVAPELTQYAERYEEYKRRVLEKTNWDSKWHNVIPLVFDQHTWSANMIRKALETVVTTPYVICTDHDMYPVGDIPWMKICEALEHPGVNSIRFNCWDKIIPEHQYLFGEIQDIGGVPLAKTLQWSDQLHICKSDWLREIINTYIGHEAKIYLEGIMYQVIVNQGWANADHWGLWLYAPPGDMHRNEYDNGRLGDPKPAVLIRYDGSVPPGAAAPT